MQRPDGAGGWENVPTGESTPVAQPDVNPQVTGEDGMYQWDVLEGSYRVHVEAPGYEPANSIVVSVPPPVFDLHVGLISTNVPPTNAPPVANAGGPYNVSEASSVNFDASGSHDPDGDPLTYEWDFNNDGIFDVSSSEAYSIYTWNDDYTGTISLRVTDEEGLSDTASTTVTVNNVAPTVTSTGDAISENGIITVSGTINDPSPTDTFEITINWGDGSIKTFSYPAGSTEFSETHQYLDDYPSGTPSDDYTVTVTVTDDNMGEGTSTTTVTVNNIVPEAGIIDSPVDPIQIGTAITVNSTFTDVGVLDMHTAVWDWGDTSTSDGLVTETDGSGTVSGTHTYSSAGIYEIKLTVTDDDGGSDYSVSNYIVVYDPAGGFVTGGGRINSPAGAYVADSSLEGTANFGFVSKY